MRLCAYVYVLYELLIVEKKLYMYVYIHNVHTLFNFVGEKGPIGYIISPPGIVVLLRLYTYVGLCAHTI